MSVSSNYFVHTLLRARDWQHRPQLDEVCDWWSGKVAFRPAKDAQPKDAQPDATFAERKATIGCGVCALVGMGGAGKTAIADRFLHDLQAGRSADPSHEPHSIFVYSFYDDDKPENFFRHLQIWLEGDSAPDKHKSPTQLMFDIQQHQGLIILDGLEKVQESGARGGFGRLTSPSLRDLLNHIACGSARELSVLVTSRFPLTDLRDNDPRYFHTILIDQIELEAGIALLRQRGVCGNDMQLAPIVEHCGRHALTIDLAGGYIKEYGNGDPSTPLNLGTAEELEAEAEQEPDDDKRAVLKQGIRFIRIAQRYREAMKESDEAALALLERICLFRLGVDRDTLATIFTGPNAERISGKALARLEMDLLEQKLAWLVKIRLLEVSTRDRKCGFGMYIPGTWLYTAHPAVRDGFLQGLSRDVKKVNHDSVRKELEGALGATPTRNPSDASTLDLLEEIIHHAIQSGDVRGAYNTHRWRVGGFENLSWRLGAYERGDRICREFAIENILAGDPPSATHTASGTPTGDHKKFLDAESRAVMIYEWVTFLEHMGRLSAARRCFAHLLAAARTTGSEQRLCLANELICDIQVVSGRLSASSPIGALEAGNEALRLAEASGFVGGRMTSGFVWSNILARLAQVIGLRGRVSDSIRTFESAFKKQVDGENCLYASRGVWYSELLARVGASDKAMSQTVENEDILVNGWGPTQQSIPGCRLLLASLCIERHEFGKAMAHLSWAEDWSNERSAKDAQCCSSLLLARLHMAREHSASQTCGGEAESEHLDRADAALWQGLSFARDCGYGLYHIDLLLERARLHLLRGDAGAALDDIEVALDTGIAANEETGQVELLAANHEECGYAWAIPAGFQLRAEALLLQASQELGRATIAPSEPTALAAGSELDEKLATPEANACGSHEVPAAITRPIDHAKQLLHEALDRWHDLRDPEPTEGNNFVHPETGTEYNYKAEETYNVLADLQAGVLTRYPLQRIDETENEQEDDEPMTSTQRDQVFISYSHQDKEWLDRLQTTLRPLVRNQSLDVWADTRIKAGQKWKDEITLGLARAKVAVLLVSQGFLASDFIAGEEIPPILAAAESDGLTIIWVPITASLFEETAIAEYQAAHSPSAPLDGLAPSELNKALVDIAKTIRDAANPQ